MPTADRATPTIALTETRTPVTTTRTSRTTRRRRTVGALLVAPLLLVACGDDGGGSDTASSAAGTTPTSVEAPAAPSLEGTWRTTAISPADAETTLTDGGLAEWVDEFRARAPFDGETVLVLEIGDEWDLYGETADGTRSEIDYDASYEVTGDEVVVSHSAGSNTFRWAIDDDTLTLEHLATTLPAYEGVPEEVFQRALYMTAAFSQEP